MIQWLCFQFKYKYYVVKVPLKTMATDPVARTRQVWVIYIYNGSVLHIKLGLNQRHQAGYSSVIRYELLKWKKGVVSILELIIFFKYF